MTSPSDPSAPGTARGCVSDHSQPTALSRASSSGARDLFSTEQVAIERAKSAFLVARTAYGRKKAMRRLQELGVGPPAKGVR